MDPHMLPSFVRRRLPLAGITATLCLLASGCESSITDNALGELSCTIPRAYIADGGPGKDGIPALTNPVFVRPDDAMAAYMRDDDRVIGMQVAGEYLAIPLNIGWWHEVVNLDRGSLRLAITHCPLTGSSLVFDRSTAGGAAFGVSGLLYLNNLMMYDRTGTSSLWPQMARGARCGVRSGTALPLYPSVEMSWSGWKALHPGTTVVSSETGHVRDYREYPYGDYAAPGNSQLLSPIPRLDPRRDAKERVLGIVLGDGASVALPFGELAASGAHAVVALTVGAQPVVVFWNGASGGGAAFSPQLSERLLTFRVEGSTIIDAETGSRWDVDGRAVSGPLAGQSLTQVADSFVAYWFAWAAFYPSTELWSAP